MDKENFLKRCNALWDMNLINPETLKLLYDWVDVVMRVEGGQWHNFIDFMMQEKKRTENFSRHKTLANDKLGYDIVQITSVLNHPCQKCAEDVNAWHTRYAFCEHK